MLGEADPRVVDQMLKVEEIRLRNFEPYGKGLIKGQDRNRRLPLVSDSTRQKDMNDTLNKKRRVEDSEDGLDSDY